MFKIMIQEVYILREDTLNDIYNLDYICSNKESLTQLAEKVFKKAYNHPDEVTIHSIKTNDLGGIYICYSDYSVNERVFDNFSYIRRALK